MRGTVRLPHLVGMCVAAQQQHEVSGSRVQLALFEFRFSVFGFLFPHFGFPVSGIASLRNGKVRFRVRVCFGFRVSGFAFRGVGCGRCLVAEQSGERGRQVRGDET